MLLYTWSNLNFIGIWYSRYYVDLTGEQTVAQEVKQLPRSPLKVIEKCLSANKNNWDFDIKLFSCKKTLQDHTGNVMPSVSCWKARSF